MSGQVFLALLNCRVDDGLKLADFVAQGSDTLALNSLCFHTSLCQCCDALCQVSLKDFELPRVLDIANTFL